MATIKLLLKWLYGVGFIITGLVLMFSTSFIGGLLFIIGGLILLPPTLKIIEEKLGKPLKRQLKYFVVVLSIFVGIIFIANNQVEKDSEKERKEQEAFAKLPQHTKDSILREKAIQDSLENLKVTKTSLGSSKYIPGLEPVDVYLNLEERNFTVNKIFTEYGNTWECKSNSAGINYSVEVFSDKIQTVENIRATAMIEDVANKNIIATKQFIKYIASIPYENYEPEKVLSWIDNNFDTDKASLTVNGVSFTLHAPTRFVRMLSIERQK